MGAVSAGCLASEGHRVIGVDPVETKGNLINSGKSPIIEAEIDEIIGQAVRSGCLTATSDTVRAIRETDLSIVCVGTPSQVNGNLDLRFIRHACEEIGTALKEKDGWHPVVIRSTVLPGTMRNLVLPVLEQFSGKKAGIGFGLCHNPELDSSRIVFHDPNLQVVVG